MTIYTEIPDYRLGSCGCCTGHGISAQDGYGGWRIADDQCVCFMHQDTPRDSPPRKCSVHGSQEAAAVECLKADRPVTLLDKSGNIEYQRFA